MRRERFLELRAVHARAAGGEPVQRVDLHQAIEALEVEHRLAAERNRAAQHAGPRPPGNEGDARRARPAHDRRDLLVRSGTDHGRGHRAGHPAGAHRERRQRQPVARISVAHGPSGMHVRIARGVHKVGRVIMVDINADRLAMSADAGGRRVVVEAA